MIEQAPGYCQHSGKAKHATASAAIRAVQSMGKKVHKQGQAYRCPHCNAFHHCSVSKDTMGIRKARRDAR